MKIEPDTHSTMVVHVVDDDESVRRALVRLLKSAGHRVESFASAEEFTLHEHDAQLGCLVLDVRLEGIDGMKFQQRLAAEGSVLPVIFLTGHGDIPMSVEAMKRGAEDFLIKPVDEQLLLDAVHRALERSKRQWSRLEGEAEIRGRADRLSAREFEVMRCLLTGALNKQIAAHLGIVEKTVKVHRARVFEKMGVHSVAELVPLCAQIGVEPEKM